MASATAALVVFTGTMLRLVAPEEAFCTAPSPLPSIKLLRRVVRTLIGSRCGGILILSE